MMPLGEAFYRRKVQQIQSKMQHEPFDGLLLLSMANVIYASGFLHTPSERPIGFLIPESGEPTLFIPLLEKENAMDTWVSDIRTYFEFPGETHPVAWMKREANVKILAVDSLSQSVFSSLGDGIQLTSLVNQMRWIKDPEELALIEKAATYADYCLEQVRDNAADIIKAGGTELDTLRQCVGAANDKMKAEVGELFKLRGRAVVGTVHSGPRAALPHGAPIDRQPQTGETLIAGIGASVGGYHAESGATFIVGEPIGDQMAVLQAADACDAAAVGALRQGNTCARVNEIALAVLKDAGLSDAIRHRIGHGMGIEGHEAPWLAPGDNTLLVPNMVFSNEPGIYRPNLDGYRTISTMIVTESEARVPSRFLRENSIEQRILAL